MTRATYDELKSLLERLDLKESPEGARAGRDHAELKAALDEYFVGRESQQSVVGVDIYRYSQFPAETQRLVPLVFDYIYRWTVQETTTREPMILAESDLQGRFISAGDGGFQIVDSPLQALVFAIFMQANVQSFNAGFVLPRLRRCLGEPLTLRYAITQDTLFQLDDNWFGSAIISNARVLSRDRLNRCLIDERSIAWFCEFLGSIESLQMRTIKSLRSIPNLLAHPDAEVKSLIFAAAPGSPSPNNFRACNVQKIGVVTAKQDELNLYNLHVQIGLVYSATHEGASANHPMMVTIGNLNTSGITA